MKYTPKERMDIGRRIYERELTCQSAAEVYGIHKHTAKRYLWMSGSSRHPEGSFSEPFLCKTEPFLHLSIMLPDFVSISVGEFHRPC